MKYLDSVFEDTTEAFSEGPAEDGRRGRREARQHRQRQERHGNSVK